MVHQCLRFWLNLRVTNSSRLSSSAAENCSTLFNTVTDCERCLHRAENQRQTHQINLNSVCVFVSADPLKRHSDECVCVCVCLRIDWKLICCSGASNALYGSEQNNMQLHSDDTESFRELIWINTDWIKTQQETRAEAHTHTHTHTHKIHTHEYREREIQW